MKRLFIIFVIISICCFVHISSSFAQTSSKAYQLFEKREYATAIPEFEKESKKKNIFRSQQALIEGYIGISYFYLNKPKEAVSWISKSINHGNTSAQLYCINGLTLQKQEKYDEAIDSFQECLKNEPDYPGVKQYIASCKYAISHSEPNNDIKLHSSKINTDGSEYGISPAANEIFFSLAATKGRNIDPRTGLGFTEVYSATLEKDELVNPKKEKTFMKAFYNTGVFAYDSITNYIYMTMCDPKSGRCGIYRSSFNRKKWGKPEPFFINENYDMAHPALAKNGDRLYFTSNASGGYGKTDIWYADRISENQWSEPVNAGEKINTAGRDEFPYVENDQILYFSSDGHLGFGGLDIFSIPINNDEFGVATNLGRPFNSGADDFNLITFGEKGLLVSSRNLSKNDDIYIFNKTDIPSPTLSKDIEDQQEEPEIIPESDPQPVIEQPTVREIIPVDIPKPVTTRPKEGFATFYYDFNLFVPLREYREMYENVAILLKSNPNTRYVIEGYADDQGNALFNLDLSEKRAKYIYDRLVDRGVDPAHLSIKGFGDSKPVVPKASTEDEYQLNRRVVIRVDLSTK